MRLVKLHFKDDENVFNNILGIFLTVKCNSRAVKESKLTLKKKKKSCFDMSRNDVKLIISVFRSRTAASNAEIINGNAIYTTHVKHFVLIVFMF